MFCAHAAIPSSVTVKACMVAAIRVEGLMLRVRLIGAFLLTSALTAPALAADGPPMLGFSATSGQAERALETRFDANLSKEAIRTRLKDMASQPNNVGSPHDKANAEATLAWLKSWG